MLNNATINSQLPNHHSTIRLLIDCKQKAALEVVQLQTGNAFLIQSFFRKAFALEKVIYFRLDGVATKDNIN